MGALSNGAASPSSASEGANAIGSYLDHLAGASSHSGGAGIPSYLSTVATSPSRTGGGGITSYLNGAHLVNGASAPRNTKSAPAVKVSKYSLRFRLVKSSLFCSHILTFSMFQFI